MATTRKHNPRPNTLNPTPKTTGYQRLDSDEERYLIDLNDEIYNRRIINLL
jgi:hypothetical protein